MDAVLINYDKIIDHTLHSNLLEVIGSLPPKSTKYLRGVILIISKEQLGKLSLLPLGQKRVNYISDPQFVQSIKSYYYVLYSEKRNLCQLNFNCGGVEDLQTILQVLKNAINSKVVIWISLTTKEKFVNCLDVLVQHGFDHPYITDNTPFGLKIPHSLALVHNHKTRSNKRRVMLEILYVLQQYKQKGCSVYCRFDTNAIKFLKKASDMGYTKNGNGHTTQKEITGQLKVVDVMKGDGKTVFVIGIDRNSIEHGVEEEVTVSPTRYNFHSHPREAYVRHSVEKAWPSSTDYLGYLKLGKNTIFHTVATMEGLYVMSFNTIWVNNLGKIDKKFVEEKYDIDHKEKYTPFEYVRKVNKIMYKGQPIYVIKFLPWGSAASIFSVNYSKDDMNCIADDNMSSVRNDIGH